MSRPRLGHAGDPTFLKGEGGEGDGWVAYEFAVIRLVPHVHRDVFRNVGVVVHARAPGFLDAVVIEDDAILAERSGDADLEMVREYLATLVGVARGDEEFGDLALLPPSERFHWLTAPRSDVLQPSPVRPGRSRDLEETVRALFAEYVEES